MRKEKYNWWKDPKNKEEIDKLSWWDHPENKTTFNFPISVVRDGDYYVVTCNEETKLLLGDGLHACTAGKTKEEAINQMFQMIKGLHEYSNECRLNYQRFVPFRKGDWHQRGGKWFTIFGINVYFRYGKKMRGGWYIPFTKLNISVSNEWLVYKRWKKRNQD